MPRPRKCRRVCGLPAIDRFGPAGPGGDAEILMTVEEYECIRLLDWFGLTQEECAAQMQVSRPTVTAAYASARKKLAGMLVNGCGLAIRGGDYHVCRRACPRRSHLKEVSRMKIAVTYEDGQVFQHFGHTAQFKFYTVEDGKVTSSEVVDTQGSGHGALAGFLQAHGVDTLLCGGIGGGARTALAQAGIELYPGVSGNADSQVLALLAGTLSFQPDYLCAHHGHEHGEGHCHEGGCHEGGCHGA